MLATLFDLKIGFFVAGWLILRARLNVIHARSYVPALLAVILATVFGRPWIFDTRGLWADEKVDAGTWSKGSLVYRFFKQAETFMLKRANCITVLTEQFKKYLEDKTNRPVHVIPTCTDLSLFSLSVAKKLSGGILIYLGSLGGLYRDNDIIRFYRYWRSIAPNPQLWIVSKTPVMSLEADIIGEIVHYSVEHHQVPELLKRAAAGVCFIRPSFSKLASAPTKLGEYLACGVPVVCNLIGDMGAVFENSPAGVVVADFSEENLAQAAKDLYGRSVLPEVQLEARRLAEEWFDLEVGILKYNAIYQQLCAA